MIDYLKIPGHELPAWATDVLIDGTLVLDGLDESLYHGTYSMTSKSTLDVVNRSPAHYKHLIDGGLIPPDEAPEEPEVFKFGRAFHCLVLEPDAFDRRYLQLPQFGRMTSAKNRAFRDAWLAENLNGRTWLSESVMKAVAGMRESLLRIPKMRAVFEQGEPEVTCVARCPQTGLLRKVRFDWVCEKLGTAIDLKSAMDASEEQWKWEAKRRRYPVQETYYVDTAQLCNLDIQSMGFAVVEKAAPYVPAIYGIDDSARMFGERAYLHNLRTIAHCIASEDFPGYGVKELVIPYSSAELAIEP